MSSRGFSQLDLESDLSTHYRQHARETIATPFIDKYHNNQSGSVILDAIFILQEVVYSFCFHRFTIHAMPGKYWHRDITVRRVGIDWLSFCVFKVFSPRSLKRSLNMAQ